MVLAFKQNFEDPILKGSKIHSVRLDRTGRWRVGMKIHFSVNVRTKNQRQFLLGECLKVQGVEIRPKAKTIALEVDGMMLTLEQEQKSQFIKNDGFDNEDDFWKWFGKCEKFRGVVIYWKNHTYKIDMPSDNVRRYLQLCEEFAKNADKELLNK